MKTHDEMLSIARTAMAASVYVNDATAVIDALVAAGVIPAEGMVVVDHRDLHAATALVRANAKDCPRTRALVRRLFNVLHPGYLDPMPAPEATPEPAAGNDPATSVPT